MADRRLVRQKKAMLRARSSGVMSDIEIHMEGASGDARYQGEIYRRGLTPEDLEAALHRSAADGFKVCRCASKECTCRSRACCCGVVTVRKRHCAAVVIELAVREQD